MKKMLKDKNAVIAELREKLAAYEQGEGGGAAQQWIAKNDDASRPLTFGLSLTKCEYASVLALIVF